MRNRQLKRLNLVLHNGVVKTIDMISPGYVAFIEDKPADVDFGPWVDLDEVKFIQITKEVLFNMGAENFPDGKSLKLGGALIGFAECRNVFFMKANSVELLHVHQTQNLFSALNLQELTPKL